MIVTGSSEFDAIIAELEGQVLQLTEQNATKAGRIAMLQALVKAQEEKLGALPKQEPANATR